MKNPTVLCSCCRGTGRVELSGIYLETWTLLRGQAVEMSGADLARKAGCKPTAMNNRLAWLEEHGLARSRPYGRRRLYRAVTGGAKA